MDDEVDASDGSSLDELLAEETRLRGLIQAVRDGRYTEPITASVYPRVHVAGLADRETSRAKAG